MVHHVADVYPDDAHDIPDEQWIADGCSRGWVLLTKDRRIRYRTSELDALSGHLFCLADGNLRREEMAGRFLRAMKPILRAVARHPEGFWHVYADGSIRKMWP